MIPYGRQHIDEDDIAAVAAVLRSDFLTTGPAVAAFEGAFSDLTGADYAVACSNGTTALHLACLALGLGPGDAVIVPTVTFLATANAVRYTGAEVVFSDVNPQTGLMGPAHLEEALTRCGDLTPQAVFPVHLTGRTVDLKSLSEVSRNAGLKVVSDSCHAVGGTLYDTPVGSCTYSDMATFSFHPVKTIAMGEGGAVTTNNPEYAAVMKRLRHHGMAMKPEDGPWCYEMPDLGYNHRLTDMQCALGLSQLRKLDKFVARRKALVALYDEALADFDPVIKVPACPQYCDPAWHLYAVRVDFKALSMTRAEVMNALKARGIGTQVHYIPVHTQPYYKNRYGHIDLPGAAHYYAHTLSLPLYPSMRDEDIGTVVQALRDIL